MAHIDDVNTESIRIHKCFQAEGIVVIESRLAVDGHQRELCQVAARRSRRHLDGLLRRRLHQRLGLIHDFRRELGGNVVGNQVDILVLFPDAELDQHRKKRFGSPEAGSLQDFLAHRVMLAFLSVKIERLEDVDQFSISIRQGPHDGRFTVQQTLEPHRTLGNQPVLAFGLLLLGLEAVDLPMTVREKLIRTEFEVQSVLKKRPDHSRLVIRGRVVRKP